MQTGKNVGMQTLDDAIQDLLTKKWISPEEAYEKAIDKNRFAKLLKTPPDALQLSPTCSHRMFPRVWDSAVHCRLSLGVVHA